MRQAQTLALSFLTLIICWSAATAETDFAHRGLSQDAKRYHAYVLKNWTSRQQDPAKLWAAAERAMQNDPRAASRMYAEAAASAPNNPRYWLGLAKSLLAIKPITDRGSERYDLPVNASGAAYHAYQRAKDPNLKAASLAVVGEAMSRRSYWRPAIEALKASLQLAQSPKVRELYEKLRAEHGFRMTNYKTESDQASPRVCIEFSENLSRGQVDFTKFVSVNGKDPEQVFVEGTQLCVEGVEHGARYEVRIRAGLPSNVDEDLSKSVTLAVYVPDRKPAVHFTGRAYVLPAVGQQGIPVVTVNTNEVDVEVYRIGDRSLANALNNGEFERQLQRYDLNTIRNTTGNKVYQGILEVQTKLNEEVTTAFPVTDSIGKLKPGAYVMVARPTGTKIQNWHQQATQWFIVSDLGLTSFTGDDGIHAFVRSLAQANPIPNAKVKLVARNNEILGKTTTDANGYAHFAGGLTRGTGGQKPAILVAENETGEYAFLNLATNAFDLSDRGVKGREPPGPLDAYLYTERGVYRPGENVAVTALVRTGEGVAATIPTTLIVHRPDGVEHGRYTLSDQGLGGRALNLPLGGGVMTGTWRAMLHTDPKEPALSTVAFLVEDFVPERLALTLKEQDGVFSPESAKNILITSRYLYGPPAAGLALEGDIIVKPSHKPLKGFDGYQFGPAREQVTPVRQPIERLPKTDKDGNATLNVKLPAITKTTKPLEAKVLVRVREAGGRAIERTITVPVSVAEPRIGIKPLFSGNAIEENSEATFETIFLNAAGKPEAKDLDWKLVRLETTWQWYSRHGNWSYEAQTISREVASGKVTTVGDQPAKIPSNVKYGRYRLEVSSQGRTSTLSSVEFTAGWYAGNKSIDTPELLDVALDKNAYQRGDTAKLRIATKHGGKALVAVLGQKMHAVHEVELPKGGGEVPLKVGEDWGPGAYATALLYRPMDRKAKRMPQRAIGIRWVSVDQKPRTLNVSIDAEDKIKSGAELKVPVKISGLSPGEEAYVTIAAVDVGILNLTGYKSPAPETHFYAQRKLAFELHDFYGRLIDGMRAERGRLRSGGDGLAAGATNGTPPVEETISLFSGILPVDKDGTATAKFAVPLFNGTVRVMAVAWSKNKLGHSTENVIIRDKVALTASVPRFLTLGDSARFNVAIHNVEGQDGTYTATLTDATSRAETVAERAVILKSGERKSENINVKPQTIGLHTYDVRVAGPDGIDVSRRLTIDVKPPAGDVKRTTTTELAASGGRLTLTPDLVAGLIPSRTRINLSAGPTAQMDVPGLLTSLDRYPYGCAEQTVSRALPLLYVNAIASDIGLSKDAAIKTRIQGAIDRLFEMQDSSGAFGSWGPRYTNLWLTAYVTDFLTRAKEAGYTVRPLPFSQALDRLQNFALNGTDFKRGGENRAYALYVLARNGRAPQGELRYYVDTRLDRFATPLAKAQLGAALAMLGDKVRAEAAFRSAIKSYHFETLPLARKDYGSSLRDGAALVTLTSETGLVAPDRPRLINVISEAYAQRTHTSTQEQAWMLLAAHALAKESKSANLLLNGAPVQGPITRGFAAEDLRDGITVENAGETATKAVISVIGESLTPEPAASKGFEIKRSFYKLDGTPADLQSATGGNSEVAQNQRFVAIVKVSSNDATGRVLLVDRLPAGFEIENPRLVDSGDLSSLSWLKSDIRPLHTEFRDDRFVAAFNLWKHRRNAHNRGAQDGENAATSTKPNVTMTAAYIVRAVTPGTYVHPAATIEDMYRPERYARTGAGTVKIKASE